MFRTWLVLGAFLLPLSGPTRVDTAREALAIIQNSASTPAQRAEAGLRLLSVSPAELKSIEPEILRSLRNETISGDSNVDVTSPAFQLHVVATQLLSKITPDRKSIPLLTELLRTNALLRFDVARAIGNLGADARSAVPDLVKSLDSSDADEVEAAAFVLCRIAPDPSMQAVVPALRKTRDNGPGWVGRFNAALALLKLGRDEERSRAVLRDAPLGLILPMLEDMHPQNRLHVCEVLMLYGPPQRDFLDLLRKRLAEDSDSRVREAASGALQKFAADPRLAKPIDGAPKAHASLPSELTPAASALLEMQRALESGDVEIYKKHLDPDLRKDFERYPSASLHAAQAELPALTLLGGVIKGNSAEIDIFSAVPGADQSGTITMEKTGSRWVRRTASIYPVLRTDPASDEWTPLGRNERAAVETLKAIAAAQMEHWNRSAPATYAGSLAAVPSGEHEGYVFTMKAGAKSNAVDHAWFAEAHPARYEVTGIHSFYSDERGFILRAETRGKPLLFEMPER